MKVKNRYSIDNLNRLIIKRKRKKFLIDGRFAVEKDNSLSYWLNEPLASHRQYNLGKKINFQGRWNINVNHDLELILDEAQGQCQGDILVLKGEIISANKDALVFGIKSVDKKGCTHLQILKLSGVWQADEFNRINFMVQKKLSPDTLIFEAGWQINQNQQITYKYEKTELKTKTKSSHAFTFDGFWQINSVNKLSYMFSRSLQSKFDFRAYIESPNLYPKQGVIKYRLGIGLRQETRPKVKVISLYGTWKFSRKLGVIFEMDYGRGRIKAIEFGATVYLTKSDEMTFSLINKDKEPLGINITFSHRFLKQQDAEAFLRIKKYLIETRVEAGLRIPF